MTDAPAPADPLTDAYTERAHLLALLAAIYPSGWDHSDPQYPQWPVLYVDLPTGQATWHIHPDDWHLFAHVPHRPGARWDGHDTAEKYRRIDALTAPLAADAGDLGARLRARRAQLGLTLREVQQITGVTFVLLGRLENGKNHLSRGNARRVEHWLWRTGAAAQSDRP